VLNEAGPYYFTLFALKRITRMGTTVMDDCFNVKKITDSVYLINEVFNVSDNISNIWLSKGTYLDVIIDTGLGIWDLAGFLKSKELIGDKPYMAIATHIHFDHTGGLHQFEKTAIHENEYDDMKNGNAVNMLTYLKENDVVPEAHYDVRNFKVKPVTASQTLKDGDIIDQGDHKLQILHLPGHTKGSIALYDDRDKHLFLGDILYEGMLIDFTPTSSVEEYIDSCKQLIELAPKVNMVFPGHFRILNSYELCSLAENYIENGEKILYKCSRNCLTCLVTAVFKGRNTRNLPYNCFYNSCCCFKVV